MANDFKSNIPVEEVTLGNGDVVVFYKYLTTGESRELQRLFLGKGKFNLEKGKLDELASSAVLDIQDKAATFLIKEIRHSDGKNEPFSKEWLDNLPVEHGNVVYTQINKINESSQVPKEEKKV